MWSWFSAGTTKAANRDYTSESENEPVSQCIAHKIGWEEPQGQQVLANRPCTADGTMEATLLDEDHLRGGAVTARSTVHATV